MCGSDDKGGDWITKKSKSKKEKERFKPPETSGDAEHEAAQKKYPQSAIAGAGIAFDKRSQSLPDGKVGCAMFYLVNDEALAFV